METKKLLSVLVFFSLFLSVGCIQRGDNVVCNKPYIQVGDECCLDVNDNKICDEDETTTTTTTTTSKTTTTTTTTTTTSSTTSTTTTLERARIYGKVIDKNTNEKYGNVEVSVRAGDAYSNRFRSSTLTDVKGYYSIEVPANDLYYITIALGSAELGVETFDTIGGIYYESITVSKGEYQVNFYVKPRCEDNLNPKPIPAGACIIKHITSEGYISEYYGYKFKMDHMVYSGVYSGENTLKAILMTVQKPYGQEVQIQIPISNGVPKDAEVDEYTIRLGCTANGEDAVLYFWK